MILRSTCGRYYSLYIDGKEVFRGTEKVGNNMGIISFTVEVKTNAWGNKCHAEDPDDGSCRFLDYEPQLAKLGILDCTLFNTVVRDGVRCKECLALSKVTP